MSEIQIRHFQDLLEASRHQPNPQRLIFVFTKAEMPETATAEQKRDFERGIGGNLTPCLCVDKLPDEIQDINTLVEESRHTGQDWDVMFVSSLPGVGDIAPNSDQAQQPLQMMIAAVREGRIADFAAFNKQGEVINFVY